MFLVSSSSILLASCCMTIQHATSWCLTSSLPKNQRSQQRIDLQSTATASKWPQAHDWLRLSVSQQRLADPKNHRSQIRSRAPSYDLVPPAGWWCIFKQYLLGVVEKWRFPKNEVFFDRSKLLWGVLSFPETISWWMSSSERRCFSIQTFEWTTDEVPALCGFGDALVYEMAWGICSMHPLSVAMQGWSWGPTCFWVQWQGISAKCLQMLTRVYHVAAIQDMRRQLLFMRTLGSRFQPILSTFCQTKIAIRNFLYNTFNRKHIFIKRSMFHCHVRLPAGNSI